ncbi:phosphoglycolate phosphatase [Candidatus Methanoplasma termitum]|uniref:Gph1 protein n=1 Tax=Candidatus Methanoplasma termitum TaxID=1577791 RepID=A0A0A7LG59_9ARCH|nr:HAD family hydrolase [Candidatus Methanoplasma termitum]AIZ56486.1 phosphoglycolate phosphatase [Candidatus Methanoplasma termitum]MCL2333222.1 HAD family hydrolase [Candidatus Methanoplasma sp.]
MALDPKYKAVGFDMDGTFMKTKIDYIKLANAVFDELICMGVPESAIIRTDGTKGEIESGIHWLNDNGRKDDACKVYEHASKRWTSIEKEFSYLSRPFDGAAEAVGMLRERGYKTGIVTKGGREYAECILGMNNVIGLFDAIVARDDYPEEEAKPSPKAMINFGNLVGVRPEEILFLGDSKMDWLTARDSGAGFYGVLTGGLRREGWNAIDPNIELIDGVASLLDMIE